MKPKNPPTQSKQEALEKIKLFDPSRPWRVEGDNLNCSVLHYLVGMIKDGSLEAALTQQIGALEPAIGMQLALSIKEATAATGIGRTKLYQLINSGEIKARKMGKKTIILKDDLESFLSNLEVYPIKNQEA